MNLFEIKNYVLQNKHGTWSSASSQALLESEIFLAAQQAESDFLWNHPIRLVNDDGEHEGFQRFATNPLNLITSSAFTILDYGNKPNLIARDAAWNEPDSSNWTLGLQGNYRGAGFNYQTATPVASTIGFTLEGLTAGDTYTLEFKVGDIMSATAALNLFVDTTAIGATITDSEKGEIISRTFTAPAASCEIRFYAAALSISDAMSIEHVGVYPVTAEADYTMVFHYETLPVGINVGDEVGFIKTTQSDGSADGAGMVLKWGEITAVSDLIVADTDISGGDDDNYYVTAVSTMPMDVTTVAGGDSTFDTYTAGTPVIAQVPDSEKEFPGQMRDTLAMYALAVIEKNSNQGKSDMLRGQVLQMWKRIKRIDDLSNAAQWEQGGSPYAS